ncbi:MAG: ribosome silencing factor [Candidatus Sericytochromatia bacterium]
MEDKLCNLVLEAALDKKAIKTVVIDISDVSLMSDYMMICTGAATTHIQGIANSILEKAKEEGYKIYNIDGKSAGEWVLIDLGNIIVHIMLESVRNFYTLEKLWNNGKVIYFDEEYEVHSQKA